jgi:hypothetical protein
VPFTLAHGAAALPFQGLRLVPSALLVGTFAPDFEYFLRLAPNNGFGHTLCGTFVLTLPLALVVLWLFHSYVKVPVARLLPDAIRRRLTNHLDEFRFGRAARFGLIIGSVLLGIATHLAWDLFTHPNTWLYHHWPILSHPLYVPIVGVVPIFKVLQHGSTIVGIGVLLAWLMVRYHASEPSGQAFSNEVSFSQKIAITGVVTSVAIVGALIRAVVGVGIPNDVPAEKRFVGLALVTVIALVWWQLVAYGVFWSRNKS